MSLSWLRPAFAIPKLLQLQGYVPDGFGEPFWDIADPNNVTDDVLALLNAATPVLLDLTLAGYYVERLLLSLGAEAPDKLLDVDLSNLQYEIVDHSMTVDGHSYWYSRTGIEWDIESSDTSDPEVVALPEMTWAAAAIIVSPRDHWETGQVSYALNLELMIMESMSQLLGFVPDSIQQSLVIYHNPYDVPPTDSTMKTITQKVSFGAGLSTGEFRNRWLAVDCNSVGLLHSFNPDLMIDCLDPGAPIPEPFGKSTRWGSPHQLTAVDEIILQACRDVWRYLATDDDDESFLLLKRPAWELLNLAWTDLAQDNVVPLPPIPTKLQTAQFMSAIAEKYRWASGVTLNAASLKKIETLSWEELLYLLHNMHIIDMLSGVTVTESIIPLPLEDNFTGQYESDDGLITVQLNQAGEYVWGFLQERRSRSVAGYTGQFQDINYFEVDGDTLFNYQNSSGTLRDPIAFSGQSTTPNDDNQFVLMWSLTQALAGKTTLTLIRYLPVAVLPDETLNNFPAVDFDGNPIEAAEAFKINQRAPLGPADEEYLDTVVATIKTYMQAYHGGWIEPSGTSKLNWLITLQENMRPFSILKTGDGLTSPKFPESLMENDQFALVRFRLRNKLQSFPLESSAYDGRSMYVGFLELMAHRGTGNLDQLDEYILYITGITEEEAFATGSVPGATFGDYVYEFRTWTMAVQGGFHTPFFGFGVSFTGTPTILKVRSLQAGASWSAHYVGLMGALGIGWGLTQLKVSVSATISGWTKLYASVQWEPSDFAGLVTVSGVGAGVALGPLGGQMSVVGATTFFEPEKGLEAGVGRLVAVSWVRFRSLKDIWSTMQYAVGLDASITASLGLTYFTRLPFTTFIDEEDVFEPMRLSNSYTSTLPDTTTAVHFAEADWVLNEEGQLALTRFAARFCAYFMSPTTVLEIHGYTSPRGSENYNLELSDQRAQSVYDSLVASIGDAFSVPTQQTIVMGHGEYDARYIAGIPNGEEIAEWRRVDIVINGALVFSVFGEKGF